jgi:hypothetical protein
MIVFNVPDIDEAVKDTTAFGIRLIGKEDRPAARVASFHPKDLCGVMVELMEE